MDMHIYGYFGASLLQVFLTPSGSDAEFLPMALACARAGRLGHKVLICLRIAVMLNVNRWALLL